MLKFQNKKSFIIPREISIWILKDNQGTDKYFKVAITKCFNEPSWTSLKKMKKLKTSANNKRYKETNVKLKKHNNWKKFNSVKRINLKRTDEDEQRKESVNLKFEQ